MSIIYQELRHTQRNRSVLISSRRQQHAENKMKSKIYLLFVLFATTSARLFEGQCRKIPSPVVFPFNYNWYMGTWYEVSDSKNGGMTLFYLLNPLID